MVWRPPFVTVKKGWLFLKVGNLLKITRETSQRSVVTNTSESNSSHLFDLLGMTTVLRVMNGFNTRTNTHRDENANFHPRRNKFKHPLRIRLWLIFLRANLAKHSSTDLVCYSSQLNPSWISQPSSRYCGISESKNHSTTLALEGNTKWNLVFLRARVGQEIYVPTSELLNTLCELY